MFVGLLTALCPASIPDELTLLIRHFLPERGALFVPRFGPVLEEVCNPSSMRKRLAQALLGCQWQSMKYSPDCDLRGPRHQCIHLTNLPQEDRNVSSGPQETPQNHSVVLKVKSGVNPRHIPGSQFLEEQAGGSPTDQKSQETPFPKG